MAKRTPSLDATDHRLVAGLRLSPRATTRALAANADISESVAASRIRRLIERKAIRPTITYDWIRAGYHGSAALWVNADQASFDQARTELTGQANVIAASSTLGEFELLLHVLLSPEIPTPAEARSMVDRFPGLTVERSESVLSNHIASRSPQRLNDFVAEVPSLPKPVIGLDEIDRSLCAALSINARTSNREIARAIGTSERTVRTRLSRLEESGLVQLTVIVDPAAQIEPTVSAEVGAQVVGDAETTVAQLRDDPNIMGCVGVTGTEQLRFVVSAPSTADLSTFVSERIKALPTVRSTSVHVIGENILFDQRWSHTSAA